MIRFHDPFRISKRTLSPPVTAAKHYPASFEPMSQVQSAYQPKYRQQEHAQKHSEHMAKYRSCAAPQYLPQSDIRHKSVQSSPVRERRPSAIAANFQIPRAVNDSGGSLAELAAQITCLFWFESADVLREVADSVHSAVQPLPLSPDVRPTTGFRKWVTTILSTTCVAQNVVLLALLFIYRLKKQNPTVRGKPGSEYRLLTVALMLGNKFLDDNTYTNKTWAEVSGINVGEVHIMEVEFLSNMKYCLFTSEQDWAQWQTLLGKFAAFFETATRPPCTNVQAPVLAPASSIHAPAALPSPPSSNQASPPFNGQLAHPRVIYGNFGQNGPTPVPSPLNNFTEVNHGPMQARNRKRSLDESSGEPPAKRIANGQQNSTSPHRYSTLTGQVLNGQPIPRLTLPNLPMPHPQMSSYTQPMPGHQLPPLSVPGRAMAMAFPNGGSQALPQITPSAGPSLQPQAAQHQSAYEDENRVSPTGVIPPSAVTLHPSSQISPSYFLQQRNSPYRPVHNVSTLLYPPPSGAMQNRPQNVELNQMQYQPLGKQIHHAGRLPYVAQNQWLDGNQPQEMTPIHRWPGFPNRAPQHQPSALPH